jgi:hypothetical protein
MACSILRKSPAAIQFRWICFKRQLECQYQSTCIRPPPAGAALEKCVAAAAAACIAVSRAMLGIHSSKYWLYVLINSLPPFCQFAGDILLKTACPCLRLLSFILALYMLACLLGVMTPTYVPTSEYIASIYQYMSVPVN